MQQKPRGGTGLELKVSTLGNHSEIRGRLQVAWSNHNKEGELPLQELTRLSIANSICIPDCLDGLPCNEGSR